MRAISSILFFVILTVNLTFSQVGYISVDDEIYPFLNRMNSVGIISNYNSFEIPKTRKELKKHLITVFSNFDKLDKIDRNKLSDFITEFEVDLINNLENSKNFIPEFNFEYLISEKEKYLYSFSDNDGSSLFINFIGKVDYLHQSDYVENNKSNAFLYRFGGDISGTIFNSVGFGINSTNGSFSGNKKLAQNYSSLRYNFKFNAESSSELGDSFFDETSAFLAYEKDFIKLKVGNDRKLIGYGNKKVIIGNDAPRMDYLSLDLTYKSLDFSFFHGKLLGTKSYLYDEIQGGKNVVSDKYLSYHRFGLNLSRHFNFAVGEMIIYSNRNIDFSYLSPFNFYKSAEHANQDRDNTFLFLDFQNNSIDKLKLYSTILIDDIDFGKIGSGWYGNQSLISIGAYSSQLYNIIPIELEFQYIKIDPYVFSHRFLDNNYTNSDFNLGSNLMPNSTSTNLFIYYRPHYRINLFAGYTYTIHGANIKDEYGNTLVNYGGDTMLGYRVGDSEEVYLLNGDKEIFREFQLSASFEPIKNWIFSLKLDYSNNSISRSQHSERLFTTFSFYTQL